MIANDNDGNLFERQLFPGNVLRPPLARPTVMAGIYAAPPFRERFFGTVYPARTGLSMAGSWPWANDPNNPDATPDYDAWGPDDYWDCSEWERWHGTLKSKYGQAEANYRWASAWEKSGWFSGNINCRSLNTQFRNFLQREGLMGAAFSGVGVLAKPIGAAADVVEAGSEAASGAAKKAGKAVENLAEAVEWFTTPVGIALLVGGAALVAVYVLRKSPQAKAIRAATGG